MLPVIAVAVAVGGGVAAERARLRLHEADTAVRQRMCDRVAHLCTRIAGMAPATFTFMANQEIDVETAAHGIEPSVWVMGDMPGGGRIHVLVGERQGQIAAVVNVRPNRHAARRGPDGSGGVSRALAAQLARAYLQALDAPHIVVSPAALRYMVDNHAGAAHWVLRYQVARPARASLRSPGGAATLSPAGTVTIGVDAEDGNLDFYRTLFRS